MTGNLVGLVEFLQQRLDDFERLAKAATDGPWKADDADYAEAIYAADGYTAVVAGGRWGGEASVFNETADALFIAANDPAYVLADIAAKRRIIELHKGGHECSQYDHNGEVDSCTYSHDFEDCSTLKLLAAPFRSHPDWQPEWNTERAGSCHGCRMRFVRPAADQRSKSRVSRSRWRSGVAWSSSPRPRYHYRRHPAPLPRFVRVGGYTGTEHR